MKILSRFDLSLVKHDQKSVGTFLQCPDEVDGQTVVDGAVVRC
jgi:hypothetical protein